MIGECTSPVLIIHGDKDSLIKISHAESLRDNATNSEHCRLWVNKEMAHNQFNLYLDIINPIYYFWKEIGIDVRGDPGVKIRQDVF